MSCRDEKLSWETYFWAPSSCTPLPPASLPPALLHLHSLPPFPHVCSADLSPSNYLCLSVRSPSLLCALPSLPLSLCVSQPRSSLYLCHTVWACNTPPPPFIDLHSLIPPSRPPSFSASSCKCAWIATLISASVMLARMPPTVLLCLFLPDVAQKRRSCDLTVPPALCSLQSFVPVWKLDGVSLHFKCSLPGPPPSSNLMIPGGGLQENCSSAPPHPPHIPSLSLSYCIGEYNTPILPWPNLHTPFFPISPFHLLSVPHQSLLH